LDTGNRIGNSGWFASRALRMVVGAASGSGATTRSGSACEQIRIVRLRSGLN
jgi:hypothetical protein